MFEAAFLYDYVRGEWVKCETEEYIHEDIEKLPCAVIMTCKGRKGITREYMVCPKHNMTEEITEIDLDHVVTAEGCVFDGLISYSHAYAKLPTLVPIRWRIFQGEPDGFMRISGDVAELCADHSGRVDHWHDFAIAVHPAKPLVEITKFRYYGLQEWTKRTGIRMPEIVVNTAMEVLRESTKAVFGIKPSVLTQIEGHEKLTAYATRPFDLHIMFLKNFLREYIKDDFDQVFPYEMKDNYRKICQLLEIKPPKSLRKAYAYNPYAIVWYMLFQVWGVKDINLMQRFFYLKECVGLNLHDFYFDRKKKRLERDLREGQGDWHALDRYCEWLLSNKGEKTLLRWLYKTSAIDGLRGLDWDTIRSFYHYEEYLSKTVKILLLREGLTQYVYERIQWEILWYAGKFKDIHIFYESQISTYECKINDFEFRFVRNSRELRHIALALQNYMAIDWHRIIEHTYIFITIYQAGKIKAALELQRNEGIVKVVGVRNQRLSDEVLLVCRYWAKRNGVSIKTDELALRDASTSDLQDVIVKSIPPQMAMDEMSVSELLAIPEQAICPDYYHYLGMRLLEVSARNISAPAWMKFEDEKASLMFKLPYGQRIYDAAFGGNAEAQRTLGMMYRHGKVFGNDQEKALRWLSNAAESGDAEASWEFEKLRKYMSGEVTEKDLELMQVLHAW